MCCASSAECTKSRSRWKDEWFDRAGVVNPLGGGWGLRRPPNGSILHTFFQKRPLLCGTKPSMVCVKSIEP